MLNPLRMSNWIDYVATIKTVATLKRSASGTYGLSQSVPSKHACAHADSRFLCAFCVKFPYSTSGTSSCEVILKSIESSKPDCSAKKDSSPNRPATPYVSCETVFALNPPSREALFEPSLGLDTK